ncbi:MAG: phage portal protein [Richelia sp. CSU_2_1]|nr:phage portal protein [Richelia sp. CSU_2_1]
MATSRSKILLFRPSQKEIRPAYPQLDPVVQFQQVVRLRSRPPFNLLRATTRIGAVNKCIQRIQRGVALMPWHITPPKEDRQKPGAIERAIEIERSLRVPNYEINQNNYTKYIFAIVKDLLTLGVASVQRMPGGGDVLENGKKRCFFAFCVDAAKVDYNPDWQGDPEEARYLYRVDSSTLESVADEEMFPIQLDSSSYEMVPPSPVEVAFPYVLSLLSLNNFQHNTTSKSSAKYILDIGDVSQGELNSFREYWETSVEIDGKMPIAAGKGIMKVLTLGAASDGELFLGWTEFLLRMISQPFGLTPKDLGHEQFTYATAGVSADASYQEGVVPIAHILNEHENTGLIGYYEPGFTKQYADTEKRTEEQEATRATTLFEKNLATRNEMRLAVGLEPIGPAGDKFADGMTLQGDSQTATPLQQPQKKNDTKNEANV